MSEQLQGVLPFNHYNGQHLVVHLRGPRVTPQFVATGGLLHAYGPGNHASLPAFEYPMTNEDLWDTRGEHPPPKGVSFEEEVAGYVEHTAEVLFDLIQDTAELERVAQRLQRRKRPPTQQAAETLRDEQAEANTCFGEVLEQFCLNFGANAAETLAHWVAEVAERLDEPGQRRGHAETHERPGITERYP